MMNRMQTCFSQRPLLVGLLSCMLVSIVFSTDVAAQENAESTTSTPLVALDDDTPNIPVTADQINTRLEQLQAQDGPPDPATQSEINVLQEALDAVQATDAEAREARRLEELARTAPAKLTDIESRLATPAAEVAIEVDESVPIEQLEADLAQAKSLLKTHNKAQADLAAEADRRRTRRASIADERSRALARIKTLQAELNTPPNPDDSADLTEAKRWQTGAQIAAEQATIERLDAELQSYEARETLLRKQQLDADRAAAIETRRIAAIEEAINLQTAAEAERQLMEAQRARQRATDAHPLVQEILDENVALSQQLVEVAEAARVKTLAKQRADTLEDELDDAFEKSRNQVERVGLNDAIGLQLRNQQSRLPDVRTLQRNRSELQETMTDVQIAVIEHSNELDELRNDFDAFLTREIRRWEEDNQPVPTDAQDTLRAAMADALQEREDDLTNIINANNAYFNDTLLELDREQGQLLDTVQQYEAFISKHILWIQSADALHFTDVERTWSALSWLTRPTHWTDLGRRLWENARENPIVFLSSFLLLILLLALMPRMRKQLEEIRKKTSKITTDGFGLTIQAAAISIAMSLPFPAILAVLGWRIKAAAGQSAFAEGVAAGFLRAATVYLAIELLRNLIRPNGLAESHFKWSTANLKLVRFHLRWLTPLILIVAFLVAVTDVVASHHNSLGRLAFIIGMLAISFFAYRVCSPTAGILKGFIAKRQGGWLDRLRWLWFPLLFLSPAALAVAAALGYFYTSIQLERRVVDTTYLILIAIVLNAFLLRWLFVAQRKLAIEQARKRAAAAAKQRAEERAAKAAAKAEAEAAEKAAKEAEAAAKAAAEQQDMESEPHSKSAVKGSTPPKQKKDTAQSSAPPTSTPPTPAAPAAPAPTPKPATKSPTAAAKSQPSENIEEIEIDVAAVSAQTRKLLSTLLAFAIAIGLYLVWVDVLPAFGIFDEIVLWNNNEAAAAEGYSQSSETTSPGDLLTNGGNGASDAAESSGETSTAAQVLEAAPITLASVIYAILIIVITVAVSRNIPGLLEIAILQRLPITAGARYAISTIVRYALVIVGAVLAFNAIGIGWSQVQWLAAAITVGLGFGLQEIFANFVSGLIILLERPIRVGDTVKVGEVVGTVTQIKMRATTISDWDRKELIIPNREFVTGQVINWTLSDPIVRIRVPVGIAYGSDVELAREKLLEAVKICKVTLNDPPPQAVFLGFGASSLDMELRAFVANIDVYVPARDRLHTIIDRLFREANIEISFPQQDLHIRSVDAEFPIQSLPAPAEADAEPAS